MPREYVSRMSVRIRLFVFLLILVPRQLGQYVYDPLELDIPGADPLVVLQRSLDRIRQDLIRWVIDAELEVAAVEMEAVLEKHDRNVLRKDAIARPFVSSCFGCWSDDLDELGHSRSVVHGNLMKASRSCSSAFSQVGSRTCGNFIVPTEVTDVRVVVSNSSIHQEFPMASSGHVSCERIDPANLTGSHEGYFCCPAEESRPWVVAINRISQTRVNVTADSGNSSLDSIGASTNVSSESPFAVVNTSVDKSYSPPETVLGRALDQLWSLLDRHKSNLVDLGFLAKATNRVKDQTGRIRESLRKQVDRNRALRQGAGSSGHATKKDRTKMRYLWVTGDGNVVDSSGEDSGFAFPVEDLGGREDVLFPDFDCNMKKTVLDWQEWRRVFELNRPTTWLGYSVPYLDFLAGLSFSEYTLAERECPLGVATAHVLWYVHCFMEGDHECAREHGNDVLRTIANVPLRILTGTRWPIFAILSSKTLRSSNSSNSDSCEHDKRVNWTEFRTVFESPLQPDWFNRAMAFVFSAPIESSVEHSLQECPFGFLTAVVIKLLLCASSESACYETYEQMLMSELTWQGRVSDISALTNSDWPILWMLFHVQRVRRHQFRVDFMEKEIKAPIQTPENVSVRRGLPVSVSWWSSKRSRPFVDVMNALLLGNMTNTKTVYVSMVYGPRLRRYIPRWIKRWTSVLAHSSDASLMLFTLDRESYELCRKVLRWMCIRAKPSSLHRYTLPLVLVNLGYNVVFIEFDVFPVKDPTAALKRVANSEGDAKDILVGSSFESSCVCSGIIYFRSCSIVSSWLVALLRWLYTHPYEHDQKACAAFLRHKDRLTLLPLPLAPSAEPKWGLLDASNQFISLSVGAGNGWYGNLSSVLTIHWHMRYNFQHGLDWRETYGIKVRRSNISGSSNTTVFIDKAGGVDITTSSIDLGTLDSKETVVVKESNVLYVEQDGVIHHDVHVEALKASAPSSLANTTDSRNATLMSGSNVNETRKEALSNENGTYHISSGILKVFYPSPGIHPAAGRLYKGSDGMLYEPIRRALLASRKLNPRRLEHLHDRCHNYDSWDEDDPFSY